MFFAVILLKICKNELKITTGSTLYNIETGEIVSVVPAGTSSSLTYTSTKPSSFVQSQRTFGGGYDVFVETLGASQNDILEALLEENKKRYILKEKKSLSEE